MKRSFLLSLLLVMAFALLANDSALAQDPTPSDDDVNKVAKQLYCPVCENIPLDVCPTQACEQWRGVIREKLAQGWSEEEIKDYFVQQYGDRVLAVPPLFRANLGPLRLANLFQQLRTLSFNVFLWIGILIGLVVAAYIVYKTMVNWKKPLPQVTPDDSANLESDDYVKRIEEELRQRK